MTAAPDPIRVHRDGRVKVVTLARPEKRNALTPPMLERLAAEAREVGGDWGALLVAGEGPAFCAGFDLDLCKDDGPDQPTVRTFLKLLARAIRSMHEQPRPVVMCAHGSAIAGGCALLGGADVVVADRAARLGYPVARLGISPAVSSAYLRLDVGDGPARSLMLDTRPVDAARAARLGLVHELTDTAETALGRASALAAALAAKPAEAVRATKTWCRAVAPARAADGALEASLALVGAEEARRLLAAAWR